MLLISVAPLFAQNSVDLSGPWRVSPNAGIEAARPEFDDSGWSSIEAPLGIKRLAPGTWLRRSFPRPQDVDTIVLGFKGNYACYVNGVRAEAVAFDRWAKAYSLPTSAERITIALQAAQTAYGPAAPNVDAGPEAAIPRASLPRFFDEALARSRSRLGPYSVLGGIQLAQTVALTIIWIVSGRRYAALIWAAVYMLYSAYNNLLFSFFPQWPAPPRFWPLVAFAGLAVSIWRPREAKRWIAGILAVWAAALLFVPDSLNVSPWFGLAVAGVVLTNVTRTSGAGRIVCILLALYIQAPGWSTWANRPLVFDSPLGIWPVLGMSNIGFALAVILHFMRRFASDRRERERLAGELEAARMVQQLMFTGCTEGIDAVYHPAAEVGGDFYQVLPREDGSLLIAVGDVSGKGLKAAMIVSMLVGILRSHRRLSPGALLTVMNNTLAGKIGGGFVTCLIASIGADGRCTIANAGHPFPYSEGREVSVECGLPLGVSAGAVYVETAIAAAPLTLVSDGVIEAANPKGELFGFDRARDISTRPASEIAEAARAWGQTDDITVVTVRRALA